ncbi:TRAP transporter small permease subunit, partial [Paracoccus sp. (in: a-proteobacteria)]|uniref:TRAP transporter small permease subunit n=1 Tax=Paracoccus sp. TaxID=267 RepID=UPI0026E026AA
MSLADQAPRAGIMPAAGRLGGRLLAAAGAGLTLLMVVVTCIDVVGRYLFNRPFGGAFEITQMSLAALVFVALPLTTRARAHVEVDLAL